MKQRYKSILLLCVVLTLILAACCDAHRSRFYSHNRRLHVAVTNPAVAEIARQIGGDKVYVTSLLKADQDVRNPVIYRSMVQAVRDCKVLIRLNKEVDPWIEGSIEKSRNKGVASGAAGYVDCSSGLQNKGVSISDGFWNDVANKKVIAADIAAGFSIVIPKGESFFVKNLKKYVDQLEKNDKDDQAK